MIRAALFLGLAAEFIALAMGLAAALTWGADTLRLFFAYVAAAGVMCAIGLGALWRSIEHALKRRALRRRLHTADSLSGFSLVENPQPTL